MSSTSSSTTEKKPDDQDDVSDRPLTTGISHVGLAVSDLEASFAFFQALGFEKVGGNADYPSYFCSDGTCLVTLWQTPVDHPTPFDRRANVGLHHLALQVPDLPTLHQAYQRVSTVAGVRMDGEGAFAPQPLGTKWTHAMLYEPSGNRIELTCHSQEED